MGQKKFDKELYDKDKTTTKHQTMLFGDESNQVIGGFKFDQIDNNRTEIVGKNHTTQVVGDKKQYVDGQYISRSKKDTEITGGPNIELNPPSPIDE